MRAVGVLKPDGEIYLRCIDMLNVKLNDVIMVSDDLEKDVKKPIKIGMNDLLFDLFKIHATNQLFLQQIGLSYTDSVL